MALVRGKGTLSEMLERELFMANKDDELPARMKKFFEPGAPQIIIRSKAVKLPKRIGLDKIDAFLRVTNPKTGTVLVTTNQVKNTATPQWNAFAISTATAGGKDTILHWEVFDWQGNGQHRTLGGINASLSDVLRTQEHSLSPVDEEADGGKKKRKAVTGTLVLQAEETPGEMMPFAVTLHLSAVGLDNRDGPGGRSDPFFAIYLDSPPADEQTWTGVENVNVGVQEDEMALGGASKSMTGLETAIPEDNADSDGETDQKPFVEAPWDLREDLRDRGYVKSFRFTSQSIFLI